MDISSDYKDLFKILNRHKVRYLIVGAYAVTFYTEPRFTKDLDIWADPSNENAARLYKALRKFGAPLRNISVEDFMKETTVYQIGVAPVRIDIIMGLAKLTFDTAWKNRTKTEYGGTVVYVLGLNDLIDVKRQAKRPQDILDVKNLIRKK